VGLGGLLREMKRDAVPLLMKSSFSEGNATALAHPACEITL
jgi:hypothetical protein